MEKAKHMRAANICEILPEPDPKDYRVSQSLLNDFHGRKLWCEAKSDKQKWEIMYRCIFPDDTVIPSPCKWPGTCFEASLTLFRLASSFQCSCSLGGGLQETHLGGFEGICI
jgi:hypothetical protein